MVPTWVVLHCTATDHGCDDYGKVCLVMATQVSKTGSECWTANVCCVAVARIWWVTLYSLRPDWLCFCYRGSNSPPPPLCCNHVDQVFWNCDRRYMKLRGVGVCRVCGGLCGWNGQGKYCSISILPPPVMECVTSNFMRVWGRDCWTKQMSYEATKG